MSKTYTVKEEQSIKKDRDKVEIVVEENIIHNKDYILTAEILKTEIEKLTTKLQVIEAAKGVLENELIKLYVEADKYIIE